MPDLRPVHTIISFQLYFSKELIMFSTILNKLSAVSRVIDYRLLVFVLMLVLLVIGAGAPGATGLNGG
jgi:hypothetical protein